MSLAPDEPYADVLFSWAKTEPLGYELAGFRVKPTNKIYYDRFPYKVSFNGNRNFRDIDFHSHLTDWLIDNFPWCTSAQFSSKSRNVYFTRKYMVDEVVKMFGHEILEISGPIDDEHIQQLQGSSFDIEYRDKYWYNKYDTKIVFFARNGKLDNLTTIPELQKFIDGAFKKYQWYDFGSATWFDNYLYVTSEELDEIYPFLKINYGEIITNIIRCKLLEK